jgi:hypothetical protein
MAVALEREDSDWGVRLTARPFTNDNAALQIQSEISAHKPGHGSKVQITFSGTSLTKPLRLLDAQAWSEGMVAILNETRTIMAEMKAGKKKTDARKR